MLCACSAAVQPTVAKPPTQPAATVTAALQAPTSAPKRTLTVQVLYPLASSEFEMGHPVKVTLQVANADGEKVIGAQVRVNITDANGKAVAELGVEQGTDGVYRSQSWSVPHHSSAGEWRLTADAETQTAAGSTTLSFQVINSTSEELLSKYGFWLDAPALRGIAPSLFAQLGDAENGMIQWGGGLPNAHIMPENWVEVRWRKGDFHLDSPEAVRFFMLSKMGNLGMTPIRGVGPFKQVKFKQWDAWQVEGRGQFVQDQVEWMVFYAPKVDKTYLIGTTVVLPPSGIDAHQTLRESFAVYPNGNLVETHNPPLPDLLPSPDLISPEMGAQYEGTDLPIVLTWAPVKELAEDEYYQVTVDYNYAEAKHYVYIPTREMQVTVPKELLAFPNCAVFNWKVTLMHKTGEDENGQWQGKPIGYDSLYWYVRWIYPPGQTAPFEPHCQNTQY